MKMDTFLFSTWRSLPRSFSENTLSSDKKNIVSNVGIQIYNIQQSVLKKILLYINLYQLKNVLLSKKKDSKLEGRTPKIYFVGYRRFLRVFEQL